MKLNKPTLFFIALAVLTVSGIYLLNFQDGKKEHPSFVYEDHYFNEVKKVFDARCVACHACYNSPCQLNLTSYDGVIRGGSNMDPYDFPLVNANPSTRLGIDAQTVEGWRKMGFFSVINNSKKDQPTEIDDSVLLQVIHGAPASVDMSVTYVPEESRICPSSKVDKGYLSKHSMPFGLPKLNDQEVQTLTKWVLSGAKGPNAETKDYVENVYDKEIKKEISDWESVLNQKSYKHQLSARYFYEHLYSAHINFQDNPKEFFRIVRVKNREGYPDEIATTRPFDDPKTQELFYRFKKVDQTIVHKAHTVFKLNPDNLQKFKDDFLNSKWEKEDGKLPGYSAEAANAFLVFKDIPVESRYRFFLENARYFIMTFMKGPVCRGQTALNVINDHFWVMFVDPSSDVTVTDKKYFEHVGHLLSPPASQKNKVDLFNKVKENRWQAAVIKNKKLAESDKVLSYDSIWTGYDGKKDSNALLTVYRHYDSSNVLYGAHGTIPKTIWVMDYQIFEDIYYNLVAGYNVFGPVLHQINTRLYMDISRIESEDMFINFMPTADREKIRKEWTQPAAVSEKSLKDKIVSALEEDFLTKVKFDYKYVGKDIASSFLATTEDPKSEFLRNLAQKRFEGSEYYKSPDLIRKTEEALRVDLGDFTISEDTHSALNTINGVANKFVEYFPDVVFLKLTNKKNESKTYTIVRNKFHYNVSMMFFEDQRRNPAKDTLDVLPLYAASYPNYFLDLDEEGLQKMVAGLHQADSKDSYCKALRNFGINRNSEKFWSTYDGFNEDFKQLKPIDSGLFDLNRYQDACQEI